MNEPRQGAFDLRGPDKTAESTGMRVWLLAGEEGERDRLGSLTSGDAAYSHAFVDSGTGFPVLTEGDLILIRTGLAGRFNLLVPGHGLEQSATEALLNGVTSALADAELCGRRTKQTCEILSISFVPGGFDVGVRNAEVSRSFGRRTGLAQILSALLDRSVRCEADRVVPLCRMAEPALDERVHPALRAAIRRDLADSLAWLYTQSSEASVAAWSVDEAYRLAEHDFRRCGLDRQVRLARANRDDFFDLAIQQSLPGLEIGDCGDRPVAQGLTVRRLLGFPIELVAPSMLRTVRTHIGGYTDAGVIRLTDGRLLEILGNEASARRRLIARLERSRAGTMLHVGLQPEMHAMLGLPCRLAEMSPPPWVRPYSAAATFDPEEQAIPACGTATFLARKLSGSRVSARLRVISGAGQGEHLSVLLR